jgi:hypothetical protein
MAQVVRRCPDPAAVAHLAGAVEQAGLSKTSLRGLARLTERATETAEAVRAPDRVLPLPPALAGLAPERGLRRGSTLAIGPGGMSLAVALLAAGTAEGRWACAIGLPDLGLVACHEAGADFARLILISRPGDAWTRAAAIMSEGFDVVVVAPPATARPTELVGLIRRTRAQDTVLVTVATRPNFGLGRRHPAPAWEAATGVDLRWTVTGRQAHGIGPGHGRLEHTRLTVTAAGRGGFARPRTATLTIGPRQDNIATPNWPGGRADAARSVG